MPHLFRIKAATEQFKKKDDIAKIRKIINDSSIAGHIGYDQLGAYSLTKFAIRNLPQVATKELTKTTSLLKPTAISLDLNNFLTW